MGREEENKKKLGCKEILMITSDGCPICTDAKELLKKELDLGEIKIKRVEGEEGGDIAKKLGIGAVPSFVCKLNDDTLRKMDRDELESRFLEKGDAKI